MSCDKNPENIKNMFNEISAYYDQMNNFISLGTHFIIKILAIKSLKITSRASILDLCCGTGDFTRVITKLHPQTKIIGVDFSSQMLKLAKIKNPNGVFIQNDVTNLPFKENEFDYITMSFGLRNIENRSKALNEIYRTLKNNGKFLHLDFGTHNKIAKIFDIIVPILVKIFKKNHKHYQYLLSSRKEFPNSDALICEFEQHGFKFIKKCDYLFGTISTHIMTK